MPESPTFRTTRGIQRSLLFPPSPLPATAGLETKGVVYTKRWVVELLLDLAGYQAENNLVDAIAIEPSAGDGAFLGPMIERLFDSCRRLEKPLAACRKSLIAYELDEESAVRARSAATHTLTGCGVTLALAEELAGCWVRTGDYLFDAISLDADFVIGNPPYVRLEDIPEETVLFYRETYPTMRGRADLYVAFFEAALRQLREGGVCAFVCADRWMRNQYGATLRDLITSDYAVTVVIEMHRADAFHEEVDAYPAITVIRRQKQGSAVVASAGQEVAKIPSRTLSATLLALGRGENPAAPNGLRIARVDNWFKGAEPWPCHSPEQLTLLRKLEARFPALETYAKVGIGVASGNDAIFITRDSELVERSRLLKLALVSDICEGIMKWSGHYLVDPWNAEGLVILDEFPKLRAYFRKHEAALKKRYTAAKSLDGWYRTIDRVTHAMADKPKLYIADIKNVLDPVLDDGETYPHHNLYFIESSKWDLEVLGGLLMSRVGQFFVESYGIRMRGGYLRFQAQYLRRIRIPDPGILSCSQLNEIRESFRSRDRQRATNAALEIYDINKNELERALEY